MQLFAPFVALLAALPALSLPALTDRDDHVAGHSIKLKGTNYCLDNTEGRLEDGNKLQIYECWSEDKDQKWLWQPLEVWNGIQLYKVRLQDTDKCLAFKVPSHGTASGAHVVLAGCDSDPQQYYTKWRWDKNWICSGVGRCLGVRAQEPSNGITLGMTTTGNAEWDQPQ